MSNKKEVISIPELSQKVIAAIMKDRHFYLFGELLVRPTIQFDTGATHLKEMISGDLKWFIRRTLNDDEQGAVGAVAEDILYNPELPFRRLNGLVTTPTFRQDFSLITEPGYDPISKLYYAPDPELATFSFRTDATHRDAIEGLALLQEVIVDFPFTSVTDRLTYIAMLLTLFLRSAIPGIVPALVLDANGLSIGKSLLSTILALIAYGQDCASMSVPPHKSEWSTKVDAIIVAGTRYQVIDNVDGKFGNDYFSSVLTSMRRNCRVLGVSEVRNVPCNTVWLINGNEIQLDADTAQRIVRCRLAHENPTARKQNNFVIQNKYKCSIEDLLMKERAKYIQAALSIICAWANAGAPKRITNLQMAKYGRWEGVLGGVFDWLDKGKLLENHREHTAAVDADREETRKFLSALDVAFPACSTTGFTVSEVIAKIFCKDGLSELRDAVPPRLLASGQDQNAATAVGIWLKNASTRKVDDNYRVIKSEDTHKKTGIYKIERQEKAMEKKASVAQAMEFEEAISA